MPAYGLIDDAFPGLEYGLDVHSVIDSALAGELILFGRPVFAMPNPTQSAIYSTYCWGPHVDKATELLSAALSAANVWSLQITVTQMPTIAQQGANSVLIAGKTYTSALLQITYATSAAATMAAMVAAVNGDTNMIAAGLSAAGPDTTHIVLSITPTSAIPMGDISIPTCSVTGGSAVTFTLTETTQMIFKGVAQFEQRAYRNIGAGSEGFVAGDPTNIKRVGKLWVPCDGNSTTENAFAYPIIGGTNKGLWSGQNPPSNMYTYAPFSTSPLSGVQPLFRSASKAITAIYSGAVAQNLILLEVRGIY